jgi:hypothetical protein
MAKRGFRDSYRVSCGREGRALSLQANLSIGVYNRLIIGLRGSRQAAEYTCTAAGRLIRAFAERPRELGLESCPPGWSTRIAGDNSRARNPGLNAREPGEHVTKFHRGSLQVQIMRLVLNKPTAAIFALRASNPGT